MQLHLLPDELDFLNFLAIDKPNFAAIRYPHS